MTKYLLLFFIIGNAHAVTFQKVSAQVDIDISDISRCYILENHALEVLFNKSGQKKLAMILNEDNTDLNILVGDQIQSSLKIPRAMKKLDRFKITIDTDNKMAKEWGCK